MEQSKKTENELKKEYLNRYQECIRRIKRISSELVEIRSMRTGISVNTDGMPHGSGTSDLSDYAAELDELENDLVQERYTRVIIYKDISSRIKKLKSEKERDVLFYRYIKGMDWWRIADQMNYTERWIHKIHGKALVHFEIPKEFIEVQ